MIPESAAEFDSPISDYKSKLIAGECTERGCSRAPADGSSMCEPCHRAYKKRNAASQQRKRDARRDAKLCIWCPGDDPRSASPDLTSCLPCRIKRNRMRSSDGGVTGGVTGERGVAIAAATRTHADGRTRYHGQQKRGQQPKWQLNLQDLRHIKEDFQTFEQAVQKLATPEVQGMHKSDRLAAEQATAHVGDRMCRRTDDILDRLGHFGKRHGKRDGE